ncbi:MAG: Transcriptional regulator [Tardiphaga sp.]|jgi:AcrR family transcriptional regulator|uniref:TetR/AcrR family transcriptional regulator n=1 Tax=Tardiphaga sp. TaxID=1926292 RepID=UPI00262026AB|nr:TetR/AcrR family transcriptional regulator [Tardiphaga sp.]MDB5501135.1 Transcriptional regulator [Tardiphaga sp.]
MTDAIPHDAEIKLPQVSPRHRLMEAATRLFCKNGINATGIDAIVSEAGTAKTTLYKIFKSKSDLVEAVLEAEGKVWRGWFIAGIETGKTPREKLDSIFPVLKKWFGEEGYYGCVFINAVGEHPKDETRLRALTMAHKSFVLDHVAGLARAAGAAKPEFLAHQIGLLMDGAIVAAMVTRDPTVADAAGGAAKALLDEALSAPARRSRRNALQGGAAALAKESLSVVD